MTTAAIVPAAAKELTSYQKITADPKRVLAVAIIIISILAVVLTIAYKEYYWAMIPLGTFCLATSFLIWNLRNEQGCSLNLRAIPSLILLAVCVIGVVTALIYHQQYLTIPFLVGLLAAGYTLTLACDFENLKKLSAEIDRLEDVRVGLSGEVGNLKNENNRLKTTSDVLSSQVQKLTKEVSDLGQTKTKLEGIASTLQVNGQKEVARLRALHKAIEHEGANVLERFGGGLGFLADLLVTFEKEHSELATLNKQTAEQTAQGISNFRGLAEALRSAAVGIANYVKENGEVHKILPTFIALQDRQVGIVAQLAAAHGKLEVLIPHVNQMQELVSKQGTNTDKSKEQLDQAANLVKELKDTKATFEAMMLSLMAVRSAMPQ